MLFSDVFVILVLAVALLVPIFSFVSFKKGYELGVKDYNITHADAPKTEPTRRARKAAAATDKELKKYADILQNIENYDGTDARQKEIK